LLASAVSQAESQLANVAVESEKTLVEAVAAQAREDATQRAVLQHSSLSEEIYGRLSKNKREGVISGFYTLVNARPGIIINVKDLVKVEDQIKITILLVTMSKDPIVEITLGISVTEDGSIIEGDNWFEYITHRASNDYQIQGEPAPYHFDDSSDGLRISWLKKGEVLDDLHFVGLEREGKSKLIATFTM
jgi:hypothetical protein